MEIGESSRGAALRKKKAEKHKKRKKVKYGVPRFKITITKSYLRSLVRLIRNTQQPYYTKSLSILVDYMIISVCCFLYQPIPTFFEKRYLKSESKVYKIHHSEGDGSWEVLSLVHQAHIVLSRGWVKLAREYPLAIGDRCTFHLVKPTEFVLTSKKAKAIEITISD